MKTKDSYVGIDGFRIIAALLVAAIHTSPLASYSDGADFFLTRVLARIAVPFFFMVTGHFVLSDFLLKKKNNTAAWEKIRRYIRKILILYGASIILYLPLGIYAGHYDDMTVQKALRMLFFDGTFYHTWYFPACIMGILLVCILRRILGFKGTFLVTIVLYLAGLFGDSYFGLAEKLPAVSAVYEKGFTIWSYTRNGLFMAPVFFVLGALVGSSKKRGSRGHAYAVFLCSFALMTVEAFTLRYLKLQRHDSMYVMLVPTAAFLYKILLTLPVQSRPLKAPDATDRSICGKIWIHIWNTAHGRVRTISTLIYILYPAPIVVVRGFAKISGWNALTENSIAHYLCVTAFTAAAAVFLAALKKGGKISAERENFVRSAGKSCPTRKFRRQEFVGERTWIEINVGALRSNVNFFRSILPEGCRLMPVIKANAYGHGAVALAKELGLMGADCFCVACLQEGIKLRRAGVKGEILILGITYPAQLDTLRRYHLSQAVVDYSYAEQLKKYGKKLHVHICIDTGMHRLGERCENIERICNMFEIKNLLVDGVFTHLSADDSIEGQEKQFTDCQAARFYSVLDELKARGIKCPKIHMQASYGVLNYPHIAGDYARVGIALYGVLSTKEDTCKWSGMLCPVLSLKTRVAAVKELYAGETAGYGLSFTAQRPMKIAVLTVGYADGYPRALSNGRGAVLIGGKRAPVVGTVCMDQMMVDVSDIPGVKQGDTAVVIGRSGDLEITACDLAEQAGTITNEILSRMGERPERIMVFE